MKKTKVCIELPLPFAPEGSLLRELRSTRNQLRNAQGCDVALTFEVHDETERQRVETLFGFVWPQQYAANVDKHPRELGACENFRFIRADQRAVERRK